MNDKPDSETYSDAEVLSLDFSDWQMPDDFALEVGRIMGLWATLEDLLGQLVGKLAGFEQFADATAFILTIHSSFPQKLQMFESLCEGLTEAYSNLQGYKGVAQKIRAAQSDRNKYAHNGMALNPESGNVEMTLVSARGKLKREIEIISIAKLRRVSMKTHEATLALYNLVLATDHPLKWLKPDGENP